MPFQGVLVTLRSPAARAIASGAALLSLILGGLLALASAESAHASTSGSLAWAFDSSFRAYVTGAGGTVTASSGASDDGSVATFPGSASTIDASYAGTASYAGGLTFDAHGGALHVTFADPSIRITGPTSAALEVTASSGRIDLAVVDLSSATVRADASLVTFTQAATSLTAAGSTALGGTYPAGRALAPVTFSFPVPAPVPSASPSSSASPTASPSASPTTSPSPTPAPAVSVTVDRTTGLNPSGDTVTVTGTGFVADAGGATTGARPPLVGTFTGAYVIFGKFGDHWKPSEGGTRPRGAIVTQKWAVLAGNMETIGGSRAGAIEVSPEGRFSTTITVSEALTSSGNWGIYTYAAGGSVFAPFETFTPISFAAAAPSPSPEPSATASPAPTTNPAQTQAPATPTERGSLTWGVDADFRSYITGSIAKGSISVTGARSNGSRFTFAQTGGTVDLTAGTGKASFGGSVTFTGHAGALNVVLANPAIRMTGTSTAALEVSSGGKTVDLATLDLAAATRSTSSGSVTLSGVRAVLTTAGATVFGGFYQAGRELDTLSVSFGTGADSPAGGRTTVAAAYSAPTVPDSPPSREGIVVTDETLADLVAGKQVTVAVSGFAPGETGISVILYSTPTVLATGLTADADGQATWTGSLPEGLTGSHTLVFVGSTAKGLEFTVPVALPGSCSVADAQLDWGFKEGFRAYIESTIANGGWELAGGAAEQGGIFTWENGQGAVEPSDATGTVGFEGSVRFTGHDGVLDTTIANPRVTFDNGTAVLLLDVSGTTQDGQSVTSEGVAFASLSLDEAEVSSTAGTVTFANIPATLDQAGAAAFGTYPAGEALDPVTLSLTSTDGCVAAFASSDEAEPAAESAAPSASATATVVDPITDKSGTPDWVWILVAVIVSAAAATAIVWKVRRG